MSPIDPTRIEDLPPEAQIPVVVRELFTQAQRLKILEDHLDGRLRVIQQHIDELRLWKAKLAGALAAAGAIGGVGGAIANKLMGLF